ncbi:pep2-like protein [Capronia coronata CBS 617.96]|uniref:Pep2-like protein n=1 Tax=Capronia coronata CBS 617.96 TaxID=1182541 RepID=W9Z477_9EURO|nr:pep2-like protein [Capronia coronata CBS 617.96]EXJ96371.1 pep2-like protein [Capronia coronata CBS 617.96]
MVDLHSLPSGSRPEKAVRNNGPEDLVLERYKLRELAEGWPLYRDACEWENLKSIFHPDAYVYTTWTGRTHYLDFIAASQAGMDKGAFIMHRCHGISTDINREVTRAVTKMKATITQRFTIDGCDVDAESDCRFCFFWVKVPESGEWRAKYVRHWYEKDKLIPVNPAKVPILDETSLNQYPTGYRYLAYCQEKTMGIKVLLDMPGHRRENRVEGGSKTCGEKHDLLYWQCKAWLEGSDVEI